MRKSFLRLWLLRQVLSLPPACLRFFAGGGVVHADGRTLDPQIQFLWRSWFAGSATQPLSLAGKSLEQARQEWQDLAARLGTSPLARVKIEEVGAETVGSPYGPSPMRGLLIRPAAVATDAPLLVFFHQGGGVLGGPELSRAFCAMFAHEARCPIFIPEYRLAPLHRFPAAFEDARAAFEWAQANAFRLGARSGDVAVGGVLTGANLAARLSLDLRRDFKPLPVGQLLVTPLLDLSDPALTSGAQPGQWPLGPADLDIMVSHYAGAGVDPADPRVSPAFESVLVGQPRTVVVSAGLDALAPQAEAFVRRLMAARVRTVYRRYDTLPLGFDLFAGLVDDASAAVRDMAALWTETLRTGRESDAEALDVA